ncbi:hypothetical protein RFF20_07235 [Pasteurella multocida]|uniref:hypothetical protein n=1 Tax=Pasteurella multocida TaxID=747 RepID=UPI002B497C4E|nr:hypothetical protein [Pasteurella multocida]WRK08818.1 hypothetical protein RFF20_07235 [Pasteurella multocida]
MLDISQIITNEMRKREITFVSFSELVRTLHYLNKKPLQNSEIGDFLLLKLKPFNPYIYGNEADRLTFYYSPDLSDVTTDLDFVDDIDIVLKFAYSLCEGSLNSMEWENHFFNRELISGVLDITIPLNNKTHIEIYQNEPFSPEKSQDTIIKPHQETENITELQAKIEELQKQITELEKELQDRKNEGKNTQKIDKRNLFIKYLLAVNYGEDVANNPRSHILENDTTQGVKYANGAIQKSFELKGYKVPVSGRTLNEWTKDIKLTKQAS